MNKLNRGIVISASEYSRPFYEDLMKSLKTDYPIYICWEGLGRPEGSFEIGAIMNLSNGTIISYLKKGSKLWDWINYDGKKEKWVKVLDYHNDMSNERHSAMRNVARTEINYWKNYKPTIFK